MKSWIENVLALLRPFDPRPEGEIVADIESELHSHIEMRTQDNTALGMRQPEARRAAEQRFGDLGSTTRDCQRIRLGDRTMLQRANAVVLGMLCALTVAMGWAFFQWKGQTTERISGMASQLEQISDKLDEPRIASSPITAHNPGTLLPRNDPQLNGGAGSPELLIATVNASHDPDVAFLVGKRIAALPPREALDVIREVYPALHSPQDRKRVLKPFVAKRDHDHIVKVLHLAATDPDSQVRQAGLERLKDYAFRDFSETPTAYLDWYQRFGEQDLRGLLKRSFAAEARRLASLDATEFGKALAAWEGIDLGLVEDLRIDMASIAKQGGLLARLEQWHEMSDIEAQKRALDVLGRFGLGQDYLEDTIVKRLAGWLNSSNAQLQERSRELISHLVESGARRAIPSAAWDLLVGRGKGSKGRLPLDLPSGGKGKKLEEEEDASETILFFGRELTGDAFFFFLVALETGYTPDIGLVETLKNEVKKGIRQLSRRAKFTVVFYPGGGDEGGPWSPIAKRATAGNKAAAISWLEDQVNGGESCFLDSALETIEIARKTRSKYKTLIFVGNNGPCIGQWLNEEGQSFEVLGRDNESQFRAPAPEHVLHTLGGIGRALG